MLLVGFKDDPHSRGFIIEENPKEFRQLLLLCDGTLNVQHIVESGLAMGLEESRIRETLAQLLKVGHVRFVASLRSHSPQSIQSDAQLHTTHISYIQQKRAEQRVLIRGAGRTAALVFDALGANDVPVGWSPECKERIREGELEGVRTNYVTKRWDDYKTGIKNPRISICFDVTHDSENIETLFPSAFVIPVILHPRRLAFGPILGASDGLCGSCLNHIRASNDADWSITTAQLLHERRKPPFIADRWSNSLAWTLTNYILELIDTDGTSGLLNHSIELHPPSPVWRMRSWDLGQCTHRSTGDFSQTQEQ